MTRRRRDLAPLAAELAELSVIACYQHQALRARLVMRGQCCDQGDALAVLSDHRLSGAAGDTDWPARRDDLLSKCRDVGLAEFAAAVIAEAAERWDATGGRPWLWRATEAEGQTA